jgi:hypothetical protein
MHVTQNGIFLKNARSYQRKKNILLSKMKRRKKNKISIFLFRREKLLRTSIVIEINAIICIYAETIAK